MYTVFKIKYYLYHIKITYKKKQNEIDLHYYFIRRRNF